MFQPFVVLFALTFSITMGYWLAMEGHLLVGFALPLVVSLAIGSRSIRQMLSGSKEASPETDAAPTTPDIDPRVLAELNVPEHLTRDNFETVYKISHTQEYGFGGDTTIRLAVEEETETQIKGRKCSPRHHTPSDDQTTIQKSNVAGWTEDTHRYNLIPTGDPDLTEHQIVDLYTAGHIDESEMDERLDEVLTTNE